MDRDKLHKAGEDYYLSGRELPYETILTFEAGADWLMRQPLSERLTEEEKEKIKAIYFRNVYSVADIQSNFTEKCLIDALFGEDLFKE